MGTFEIFGNAYPQRKLHQEKSNDKTPGFISFAARCLSKKERSKVNP